MTNFVADKRILKMSIAIKTQAARADEASVRFVRI